MASLKKMTQTALIESVLDHIVSLYAPGRMEDMQKDVVLSDIFNQFFDPTEKVVKKKKKAPVKKKMAPKKAEVSPKVSLEDRQEAGVDESKCLCRIWKNGLDNVQCSRNKKDSDFCVAHIKKGATTGEWWLGLVTEARPEEPYGPPSGASRHYWTGQDQPEKRSRKKTPVSPVELTVSEVVERNVSEETVERTVSEDAVELTVSEVVERNVSEETVERTVSEDAVELTVSELVDAMVEKTVSEADAAGVGTIPPTSHMESESSTLEMDDSPFELIEESDDEAPDEIDESDDEAPDEIEESDDDEDE